jgi:HlyD family secretion protein
MFKVKATIDFKLLKEHIHKVRTGLPGMMYIKLNEQTTWPENLSHLPKFYDKKH